MSKNKVSRKAKAYELFTKGFGPYSPEVRALGLKSSTRAAYHSEWLAAGRPGAPTDEIDDELIPQGSKILSENELLVPTEREEIKIVETESSETIGEEDSKGKQEGSVEETKGETKGEEESSHRGPNGKKLPTLIAGQGFTLAVTLSTKTIGLYQIAANMSEENLTLGDFLDACVEDTYRGRGYDLGLVKIGGNHGK